MKQDERARIATLAKSACLVILSIAPSFTPRVVGPAAERLATARLNQLALAGMAINIALALQIGLWFLLFIRTYERAGGDKRRVVWLLGLIPFVLGYPVWWVMIAVSVFNGGAAP